MLNRQSVVDPCRTVFHVIIEGICFVNCEEAIARHILFVQIASLISV